MTQQGRIKKPKSGKKLIIVEGKSDKILCHGIIRALRKEREFDIWLTCPGNKGCEILRKETIHKLLEEAIKDGYSKMFVLLDLNTQQPGTTAKFNCFPQLVSFYRNQILGKYKEKIKVVVAIEEIECWGLVLLNKSGINNCYDQLKKAFGEKRKTRIAQKVVKEVKRLIENKHLNFSLQYFVEKITEA